VAFGEPRLDLVAGQFEAVHAGVLDGRRCPGPGLGAPGLQLLLGAKPIPSGAAKTSAPQIKILREKTPCARLYERMPIMAGQTGPACQIGCMMAAIAEPELR
jgi:hypothetical protein